jgi:hypothetical protein
VRNTPLVTIKLLHTVVWFVFASAIVAIPVFTWRARCDVAGALVLLVFGEVAVLALNRMRCPLTDVAARYTEDRRDNFDIYLPLWLARWNKWIFGGLFALGLALALTRWLSGTCAGEATF